MIQRSELSSEELHTINQRDGRNKEDLLLISLQSKYKNNWQKIAEKLADQRGRKDDAKLDID